MSEARTRANRKWNEANLDRLAITVKKGQRDIIKAAAENAGVSLNRYVVEAIEARMAADEIEKRSDNGMNGAVRA